MLLLTDLLKFYAYSVNNIIVFPYRLFVIGVILLTVIFFRDKKYSIVWSFAATTYVSLLFCVLFFLVVIDPGDNYNFTKDIRNMITFYNPYYRLLYQTEYSVCHLIMFIPLGYLIRYETGLIKSIFISLLIVFGIENLQIYINFFCGYVQYTYCIADILFHSNALALAKPAAEIAFLVASIALFASARAVLAASVACVPRAIHFHQAVSVKGWFLFPSLTQR